MVAAQKFPARPFLAQWLWLGCALTILLAIITVNLYRTHGRIAEAENERLAAQAAVIAANLEDRLSTINLVLDRVLRDIRENSEVLRSHDSVKDYFLALTTPVPGARSIFIVDAHGTTIASDRGHAARQNMRSESPFMEVKAHPDATALYLSSPSKSPLHPDAIHISRMIPDSEGNFAGMVSVMLEPSYLSTLLPSLLYSPGMWGAIYHSDGPALTIAPTRSGYGPLSQDGHLIAQIAFDPATPKLEKPLLIEFGRIRSQVFLQWHQDLIFRASVFTLICLVSFLAVRAFQFAQRRAEHQKASAEAILQTTWDNYQLIVENTTDLVARLDPRGYYIYLNQAFSSIYGEPVKECLGEHFAARVVEADRALAEMSFCKLNEPPYVLSFTLRKLTMDGIRHFQWTARALLDPHGKTMEIIAIGRDMTEHMRRVGVLEHQAYQDYLTGVANRRHFMNLAKEELTHASTYSQSACLLMIDVDHFKHINDVYGHRAGDLMLQSFSKVLLETLRSTDIIARVGGEEFAALMPDTTLEMAIETASRLNNAIAENTLCIENATALRVTASIGVAAWQSGLDLDDLMDMADSALYQAKHSGRNKFCVADAPESTVRR